MTLENSAVILLDLIFKNDVGNFRCNFASSSVKNDVGNSAVILLYLLLKMTLEISVAIFCDLL